MSLREYLQDFRKAIDRIETHGFAESVEIREEIRAGKQAVLSANVVLVDASRLIVKEFIDTKYKVEKISYAYQYQSEDGKLIFRYDNAKHKPDLRFMEHKHTADGKIEESSAPDIADLVDEVVRCL